jgi:DNA-binding transcriptional MerR regulator
MLSIGKVAARAGVKVDTVRFYERRGVLPAAERRSSGYRAFQPEAVDRIVFVKEMQKLGFSLDEIVDLLRLVDGGTANCNSARPRMEATLRRADEKIAALKAVRARLADLLQECEGGNCSFEEVVPLVRLKASASPHRGRA